MYHILKTQKFFRFRNARVSSMRINYVSYVGQNCGKRSQFSNEPKLAEGMLYDMHAHVIQ